MRKVTEYYWLGLWGWSMTDGMMLKRDRNGIVIAHHGDATWEVDYARAYDLRQKVTDGQLLS